MGVQSERCQEDSGSKLKRWGYAGQLRLGQTFPGVVLSSEASICVSPADKEIVMTHGVAGINCSWNRLEEIPFDKMGKGRNQRILPLLVAANTVNYGKPFKMNTAEAMAACLYIVGCKDDAKQILAPFSFGSEFLKLNHDALEAYAACDSAEQVAALADTFIAEERKRKQEKELEKAAREASRVGGDNYNGYLDDADLPPDRMRMKRRSTGRLRKKNDPFICICKHGQMYKTVVNTSWSRGISGLISTPDPVVLRVPLPLPALVLIPHN